MIITDIKLQKRAGRFNIYVDGKFSFGLDADNLVRAGLKVDQEISRERIEKLVKENEFQKVYERVLNLLSYRPRSKKEIIDWFKRKEIGQTTQELVLAKLEEQGYLNDEEFARWWVEQRAEFNPKGRRAIEFELKQKGLSEKVIVKLLDCYIAKDSEKELARKIAEKKMKTIRGLSGYELKQKLSVHLASRGFDWETVKEVVDEITEKD